MLERTNASGEREGAERLEPWSGDYQALFAEWTRWRLDPVHHLVAWWTRRSENLLLVHYNDLHYNLDAEMRRVARHLDLPVRASTWPSQVDRCRFAFMKASYAAAGVMDGAFDGGADRFFHRGAPGEGAMRLPSEVHEQCRLLAASRLPTQAAEWLESGTVPPRILP